MRALPSKRRRAVVRAVRDGRAVNDPRDAHLAVAWARRAQAVWWPRWFLPQTRPHGWVAVLWFLHAAWILVVVAAAIVIPTWRGGGVLRWVVVGAFVYSIMSLPWLLALILRTRWNSPEAERQNRELIRQTAVP
jgi:hypothetical protein